jgi:2',3'-cyclic-nucleotide 2'-phosphodiesterase (5'-nucleotidase family)
MVKCIHKIALRCSLWGLVVLLLGSLTLIACTPTANPTLPPATAVAPKPPTATLEQPTAAAVPTNTEAAPQAKPRQAVTLTILHTNDVAGETDPCG